MLRPRRAPGLQGSREDGGTTTARRHIPAPSGTCSQTNGGSFQGCLEPRRRRPDQNSQAGVIPISGRGFPGAAPDPATGPKGRAGSDSPSPTETPSPPPPSPAGSRKGSGEVGEERQKWHSSPNALGEQLSRMGPLGDPRRSRGHILELALRRVIAPEGWSCPFKRQLAASNPVR